VPSARTGTSGLARGLALLVCLGCVTLIIRLAQEPGSPAAAGSAASGDCASRKRAEIEQEKAAGRLTAEQAMIRRQKVAAECG
jgi:hypothetical protein